MKLQKRISLIKFHELLYSHTYLITRISLNTSLVLKWDLIKEILDQRLKNTREIEEEENSKRQGKRESNSRGEGKPESEQRTKPFFRTSAPGESQRPTSAQVSFFLPMLAILIISLLCRAYVTCFKRAFFFFFSFDVYLIYIFLQ